MEKYKITQKELSKLLRLSEAVLRIHLSCFEKYKIPRTRPYQYFYNYSFLLDLRDFYIEKNNSIGKSYEHYGQIVKKLNETIRLYKKRLELTKN